jgi:multisubunit Na+/H+ antiporter MnhB subunit
MIPSQASLRIAILIMVEIAVFCVAMIVCADAARGWVGESLRTKRARNQPLWLLLAFVATMALAGSVVFVAVAVDPRMVLDRRGRLESVVEGGCGVIVLLTWVAIGFRRLKQRGEEFQTLKAVRLLTAAFRRRRSRLET